jgi:hypothetical protein
LRRCVAVVIIVIAIAIAIAVVIIVIAIAIAVVIIVIAIAIAIVIVIAIVIAITIVVVVVPSPSSSPSTLPFRLSLYRFLRRGLHRIAIVFPPCSDPRRTLCCTLRRALRGILLLLYPCRRRRRRRHVLVCSLGLLLLCGRHHSKVIPCTCRPTFLLRVLRDLPSSCTLLQLHFRSHLRRQQLPCCCCDRAFERS